MLRFRRFLNELYGEPDDGTFTHDGVDYNLNGILNATLGLPIEQVPVSELTWILKYDHMTAEDDPRIANADLTAPLLLIHWEGQLVVLDGIHRLAKAVREGVSTLPATMVNQELIDRYRA